MFGRAARTTTELDAAGVLLHLIDDVLEVLQRRVGRHDEDVVFARQGAIGVSWVTETGGLPVMMPPSITAPITIRAFGSPLFAL